MRVMRRVLADVVGAVFDSTIFSWRQDVSTTAMSVIASSLLIISSFSPAKAETMDNAAIVLLTKAGLSDGLIIDKINSLPCGYEVSTTQLVALKQQGVYDSVIAAMVRRCATLSQQRGLSGDGSTSDPMQKHAPGIYLMESWATPTKMTNLRPTKSSGIKTSGNGSIFFPLNYKMTFTGQTSQTSVSVPSPVFYFYFDESDVKVSDFGSENSLAAQSPDEFSLVQLKIKNENREISVGRASAYDGAAVSVRKGIDPKVAIKFTTESLGHGIFKVVSDHDLQSGEYAFLFVGSDTNARAYPFSVRDLSVVAAVGSTRK